MCRQAGTGTISYILIYDKIFEAYIFLPMTGKFFALISWNLLSPVFLFLAVILALFLYYRAARREFLGKERIFDFVFVSLIFGLVSGRFVDFVLRADFYNWSAAKFFFFNVYFGFDIWGAALGALCFGLLFLRRTKEQKVWLFWDAASFGLSFGASIFCLGLFIANNKVIYLLYSAIYFIIFWFLKRLDKVKRHQGFFICFFAVFVALFNLLLFPIKDKTTLLLGPLPYQAIMPILFLLIFSICWYIISRRKSRNDIKSLVALFILGIFKLKRVFNSIAEADNLARTLILSPVSIAKNLYLLVSLVGREIYLSILDLLGALGFKK